MKKIYLAITLLLVLTITSCIKKGEVHQSLNGNEPMPKELQGLKIYSVGTGNGGDIKVAVLNGTANSATYCDETTIIVNGSDGKDNRTIIAKQILYENNEVIIVKK